MKLCCSLLLCDVTRDAFFYCRFCYLVFSWQTSEKKVSFFLHGKCAVFFDGRKKEQSRFFFCVILWKIVAEKLKECWIFLKFHKKNEKNLKIVENFNGKSRTFLKNL